LPSVGFRLTAIARHLAHAAEGRDMIRLSDNQPAIVTNAAQMLPVEKPRGRRSMFGFGE
jgi:hypothetical protein